MKDFIENTLHQKIELLPFDDEKRFPLILRGNYDFYRMRLLEQTCILAAPKAEIALASLRSFSWTSASAE